ncbi:MAG: hypothetical protein RQ982_06050 [Gammaproteobacteria bacterium]|nr:hypothetical protein [Gammaproteobacteria bacterium]
MTRYYFWNITVSSDFPWLPAVSQQAKDIEHFRWFSDDFLVVSPQDPNLIMDMCYSFLPDQISSMWGVAVSRQLIDEGKLKTHVEYRIKNGTDRRTYRRFMDMVF